MTRTRAATYSPPMPTHRPHRRRRRRGQRPPRGRRPRHDRRAVRRRRAGSRRSCAGSSPTAGGIVLTHGNGPQVGFIMRRSDLVADIEPGLPQLDARHGGGRLPGEPRLHPRRDLQGELRAAGLDRAGRRDAHPHRRRRRRPAFGAPTKPIGSFYDEAVARRLRPSNGWTVAEDSGRGWRRLVASPQPGPDRRAGRDRDARRARASSSSPRAAAGSRCVEDADGRLRASRPSSTRTSPRRCWPRAVGADLLCITTGVDRVAVNFGRPDERALDVRRHRRGAPSPRRRPVPGRQHGPEDRGGARLPRGGRRRGAHHEPRPPRRRARRAPRARASSPPPTPSSRGAAAGAPATAATARRRRRSASGAAPCTAAP